MLTEHHTLSLTENVYIAQRWQLCINTSKSASRPIVPDDVFYLLQYQEILPLPFARSEIIFGLVAQLAAPKLCMNRRNGKRTAMDAATVHEILSAVSVAKCR